jgi:hypothetical protein
VILLFSVLFQPYFKSGTIVSSSQIYWGAWVGEDDRMPLSTIQSFEATVGKDMSIWNWMQWWVDTPDATHDPDFNPTWMNEARNNGMIPMISWAPSSVFSSSVSYTSILDGSWDSYLAAWGEATAQWGNPYFIRLMWEFTGYWAGYCDYENGQTPSQFVQVWQYIVDHVRNAEYAYEASQGQPQKDYISWIWCPAAVGDSVSTLQSAYPGTNYVDWTATDIYAGANNIPISQDSQQQTEISNIHAVAPDKPMMFAELGDNFAHCSSWWNNV